MRQIGIEFVEEQFECSGCAGLGGAVEGDGDVMVAVGDPAGLVEEVAGDGPVFIGVA
ncbi:MAG: hypothetical protein ACYCZM_12415 [Acidimicrobiales bacterium]